MASVRAEVGQKLAPGERVPINRYFEASARLSGAFRARLNRSYVLSQTASRSVSWSCYTDSPIRLTASAMSRNVIVIVASLAIGLRLPGHGTVPAGLTNVRWEDWMAATRLAVREARL